MRKLSMNEIAQKIHRYGLEIAIQKTVPYHRIDDESEEGERLKGLWKRCKDFMDEIEHMLEDYLPAWYEDSKMLRAAANRLDEKDSEEDIETFPVAFSDHYGERRLYVSDMIKIIDAIVTRRIDPPEF